MSENYTNYREILDYNNANHPQAQGLSDEEFQAAIKDPESTFVEIGGAQLPQLTPIEHYGWLNHEFYQARYGTQIMQLTDYPNEGLSTDTKEALNELAAGEGVVVFEVSSTHPESYSRIVKHLGSTGVGFSKPELLGTQTYFMGKVDIASVEQHNATEGRGFLPTFNSLTPEAIAQELPMADRHSGVWLHDVIDDPEEVSRMYDFYCAAYEVLNDHPCRQGLDPEEFLNMLGDDTIPKIVFRRDGVPETLYIVTDKIEELSWVNYPYYAQRFADEISQGKLIWFPGIATNPEKQMRFNSLKIISFLIRLCNIGNYDPTLVFDFCDYNTGALDPAIAYMVGRTNEGYVRFEQIADQKYYAVKLSTEK